MSDVAKVVPAAAFAANKHGNQRRKDADRSGAPDGSGQEHAFTLGQWKDTGAGLGQRVPVGDAGHQGPAHGVRGVRQVR